MNLISIIGLLPFVYSGIYLPSYGCLIISINGFLFHSFPKSKILYFIDFSYNTILFTYNSYYNLFVLKYAIFCLLIFILNERFLRKKKILNELVHVVLVQWVGLKSIHDVYKINKCEKSLFICNKI